MDVLSDVLRAVRLTGAIFFDVEVSAPWVAMTPDAFSIRGNVMPEAEHLVLFHAITSGECWVEFLDCSVPSVRAEAYDIVVVPMGDAHVLCSMPGMRTEPDLEAYRRPKDRSLPIVISLGGQSQDSARFVCGYLGFDARPFNPVLQALPRILHARGADGVGCMPQLIRLAVGESKVRRPPVWPKPSGRPLAPLPNSLKVGKIS